MFTQTQIHTLTFVNLSSLFSAPADKSLDWRPEHITGPARWLHRLWATTHAFVAAKRKDDIDVIDSDGNANIFAAKTPNDTSSASASALGLASTPTPASLKLVVDAERELARETALAIRTVTHAFDPAAAAADNAADKVNAGAAATATATETGGSASQSQPHTFALNTAVAALMKLHNAMGAFATEAQQQGRSLTVPPAAVNNVTFVAKNNNENNGGGGGGGGGVVVVSAYETALRTLLTLLAPMAPHIGRQCDCSRYVHLWSLLC
jgi:leucyl-tRNA synthetase